jgi:steroid delta-isomerase
MRESVQRLVEYWECLVPASLARLGAMYTEQACFRDPFHDVSGLEAIERVIAHRFEILEEPRVTIREVVADERGAMLAWDFHFRIRSRDPSLERRIRGATHLRFAPDGRVEYHRDYWDAAELYAELPVVGALMRWLRRRMAAPGP